MKFRNKIYPAFLFSFQYMWGYMTEDMNDSVEQIQKSPQYIDH